MQRQDRQAQRRAPTPGSDRPPRTLPLPRRPASARPTRGNVFVRPSRARTSPSRRRIALGVVGGQVVVAAEMKQTVDHVERQLGPGVGPDLAAPCAAAISAETTSSPARIGVAGLGEREADHVGRPVVAEVAAVDRVDRRVVDQRDRDRRPRDALARAGRARTRPASAAGSTAQVALGVADLDVDRRPAASGSGPVVRPRRHRRWSDSVQRVRRSAARDT